MLHIGGILDCSEKNKVCSDELFGVDLSHLSTEEKTAILQVAARAKQLEYEGKTTEKMWV